MTEPRFLRLDLFPATAITSKNGEQLEVYDPTRVYVTDSEIFIYKDAMNGPAVVYEAALADFSGANNTGWVAEADDGTEIKIVRAHGCACGSLLRSLQAFRGVPYQPT